MYTQIWDHMTNAISETIIKRDKDSAFIPFDDGNRDYQEYKVWLNEGNEPNPPVKPEPPIDTPPPPDINEVNAQVQDLEERLTALEATMR